MKVLIFEPDHTGHHFHYVSLLIPPLKQLGVDITLATTAPSVQSKPFQVYLSPLRELATVDGWMRPSPPGAIATARQRLRDFRECIRRSNPDWVCLPYADGLAQILGAARTCLIPTIPRHVESAGLMMRGPFAYPAHGTKQRIRAEASWCAAKRAPLTQFHILDPIVYNRVRERGGPFVRRCSLMPDPTDPAPSIDQRSARSMLGIPEDGRYIGCVGMIDRRKGCDLLIRAFALARLGPSDRLLLVGGHEQEIKQLLAGEHATLVRTGRIISIDRFVNPDELGAALRAMDLVCTPYPRHVGSASIVIRAAGARRPVIGSSFGWVKWAIERFSLGRTCDVENIPALAGTLESGLESAGDFVLSPKAERWVRYHTPENFALTWTVRLRQRLGLAAAPALHSWDWVESD